MRGRVAGRRFQNHRSTALFYLAVGRRSLGLLLAPVCSFMTEADCIFESPALSKGLDLGLFLLRWFSQDSGRLQAFGHFNKVSSCFE